jgi:hypothetical protein
VQDVELALMEMKSETLKKIDDALRRLEEGTYGFAQCNSEITGAPAGALRLALHLLPGAGGRGAEARSRRVREGSREPGSGIRDHAGVYLVGAP